MQSGMVASQQHLLRKQASFSSGSPPEPKLTPPSPERLSDEQSPLKSATVSSSGGSGNNNNNDYVVGAGDSETPRAKKTRRSAPSSSWLSLLNPSYKTRAEEFRKLFSDTIPPNERLVVDYSCALQKVSPSDVPDAADADLMLQEILVHGRVYVTLNYICFYANIFKWETRVVIKCCDITSMAKAHTAKVIPNAIRVTTAQDEKYVLTSFAARDKTYVMMFRVWQNALLDQQMSPTELWSWVHLNYGDDLGFDSDEEDQLMGQDIGNLQQQDLAGLSDSTSSEDSHSKCSDSLLPVKDLSHDVDKVLMHPVDAGCEADEEQDESLPFLEPVSCSCPEHRGKLLADQYFQIPVDTLFTLVFSESKFYKNLMTDRKAIDLKFTPWIMNEAVGSEPETDYTKSRVVYYTVTLNHTMIKAAPTTETQYLLEANPSECYRVRTDAVNTEIPYCDTFRVGTQYCLTRGRHENEVRILIHSDVVFTSTSWSFKLVKPIIEKNAVQGICDFIKDLVAALNKYCNEGPPIISEIVDVVEELETERRRPSNTNNPKTDSLKSGASLRRRLEEVAAERASACWSPGDAVPLTSTLNSLRRNSVREPDVRDHQSFAVHVRVVLVIVCALVLFNLLLFYQLWKLESAVDEYEAVIQAIAMRNAGHSVVPNAQTITSLRKVLTKAVAMANTIEKNLNELSQDLQDASSL